MSMEQSLSGEDGGLDVARAAALEARKREEKAREILAETRARFNRGESMQRRAEKMAGSAETRQSEARRKMVQAQQVREQALRRGDAHHNADQEIRRSGTEIQRAQRELKRWNDDVRRLDRESSSSNNEVRARTLEVATLAKETYAWEQRFTYYARQQRSGTDAGTVGSGAAPDSLAVSESAIAALKRILDNLQHEPEQVLRLTPGSEGGVSLVVDFPNDEDKVVEYDGAAVLAIESELPESFRGKTLDANQTPQGIQLILSD